MLGAVDAAARAPYLRAREVWRSHVDRRWAKRLPGPGLLRAFASAYPEAFFVEIGANDGRKEDQLRPFILACPWRGIMVEPVPFVFERLKSNYSGLDRIAVENAAIADDDGRRRLYHLAPIEGKELDRVPDWYDAIGSFSRENVLRHADHIPDLELRVVCTEVPCLSFESLCRKHGVARVDLLLTDTEGYDREIIHAIDFSVHRPRLVIYEHKHLDLDERAECRELLHGIGYETMEAYIDTWCLDTRFDDAVTRRWRRLRPASPRGVPGPRIRPPTPP
jgi:FkbM family methyltransferase